MTVSATTPATTPPSAQSAIDALNAPGSIVRESAAARLDSTDFLRLMTAQLANQDPMEPQSNDEMLAQLAQFSSLENGTASRATLSEISAKLDALIEAQERAAAAAAAASEAAAAAAAATGATPENPATT
ncbi:flagellar hook assembly protein FlgD [Qipengyuania nanhaisediminis]|uniref:flagellar hook assembly protein FlgD n=1 Tax=Qipengyuania nanhaisediminis TaxID=604088 RepID=UPI0038B35B92